MVHGSREDRARKVCADLAGAAEYVLADIGQPEQCARIVEATVAAFGRIDCVVNNAASTLRSTLESTDAAFFDRMIAVNLRAPLLIIQAAVPEFRKQGGGTILNVGSVNSLAGQPNLLDYSISKGGLTTLTRNMANALAEEGIRVNHFNLGWVATENEIELKQREGLPEGWHLNVPRHLAPRGYILKPEEVAPHIVFWLSPASAPASGVVYELEQYSVIGRNFPKTSL
jgi:NAD(P)-dependent dehydrogenase (short-subunit alcohol dehydrogenase family)